MGILGCRGRGFHPNLTHLEVPKHVEKIQFSEWLADVSRITPTSITTHFHLSKPSDLPYRLISFGQFPYIFLLTPDQLGTSTACVLWACGWTGAKQAGGTVFSPHLHDGGTAGQTAVVRDSFAISYIGHGRVWIGGNGS